MPTEDEWARALETSKLRADHEMAVYLGTDDVNADVEFYDDLALLSERMYFKRLAAIEKRRAGRPCAGPMPEYEMLPPFERRHRRQQLVRRTSGSPAKRFFRGRDPLRDRDSFEFYEVLTGSDAASKVLCPLPGHDERTPSCCLNDDGRWYCHGCGRGGTVYEMAAHLWGVAVPLRGHAFGEVRDRLKELFGVND